MFIYPPHDTTGPGPLRKPDPLLVFDGSYVEYWRVDKEDWHLCHPEWLRPGIIWRYQVVTKPPDATLQLAAQLFKGEAETGR